MKIGIKSFSIAACLMISTSVFGECDFSKDIKKVENGYLYTTECHKKVGKIHSNNEDRKEIIKDLKKQIELKDLSISKLEESRENWVDFGLKTSGRLETAEAISRTSDTISFLKGVGLTVLSVWAAGQLDN